MPLYVQAQAHQSRLVARCAECRRVHQHGRNPSPMAHDFNYAEPFQSLDLDAVKTDLHMLMTDSQDWWPADYGHFGPLFIRMAGHSVGTPPHGGWARRHEHRQPAICAAQQLARYRQSEPGARLMWPIKKRYGDNLSWADLLILADNVAIGPMGGPIYGLGGGRADIYAPNEDVHWGTQAE